MFKTTVVHTIEDLSLNFPKNYFDHSPKKTSECAFWPANHIPVFLLVNLIKKTLAVDLMWFGYSIGMATTPVIQLTFIADIRLPSTYELALAGDTDVFRKF